MVRIKRHLISCINRQILGFHRASPPSHSFRSWRACPSYHPYLLLTAYVRSVQSQPAIRSEAFRLFGAPKSSNKSLMSSLLRRACALRRAILILASQRESSQSARDSISGRSQLQNSLSLDNDTFSSISVNTLPIATIRRLIGTRIFQLR